jgi:hypothetical protein
MLIIFTINLIKFKLLGLTRILLLHSFTHMEVVRAIG